MKHLIFALSLTFVLVGQAFAMTPEQMVQYFRHCTNKSTCTRALKGQVLTPEQEAYYANMMSGNCWGKCAYLSSIAECISCGLSYHGIEHKLGVVYYCRKLQPKCGR